MREYIFYVPEGNEIIGDVYYPDERDDPMPVEPLVQCRDCEQFAADSSDHDYRSGWWCHRWDTDRVEPSGFCAWGERREA